MINFLSIILIAQPQNTHFLTKVFLGESLVFFARL